MKQGSVKTLPGAYDVLAPDGSEVRILLSLTGGSMAHFLLPAGQVSRAVRHRTVEEIWYILSGSGEMWRSTDEASEVSSISARMCVTIPVGTTFQFRAIGDKPLAAIAITMPPWPGAGEAEVMPGMWVPAVG